MIMVKGMKSFVRDLILEKVNWKTKFQLPYASDWNLLLQGYGVELTSPNIPAWY